MAAILETQSRNYPTVSTSAECRWVLDIYALGYLAITILYPDGSDEEVLPSDIES